MQDPFPTFVALLIKEVKNPFLYAVFYKKRNKVHVLLCIGQYVTLYTASVVRILV